MAAATKDRNGERTPSDLEAYNGVSGAIYYKDTAVMRDGTGAIKPVAQGTGASLARFLGVADNNVNLSGGLAGLSNVPINVYKTGEYTFVAQGTGASADIGKVGWFLDDQTVGVSVGYPRLEAGEITGIPTTSSYRVRISNAVGKLAQTVTTGTLETLGAGASGLVVGWGNGTGLTWTATT